MTQLTRQTIATHGVRNVWLAIVDPFTGKVVVGDDGLSETGFTGVDGVEQGVTQANITALMEKGVAEYAGDVKKRMNHGASSPEVAFNVMDLQADTYHKVLGMQKVGAGWVQSTNLPHVAMIIGSMGYDGHMSYDAFANGEMIVPTINHKTDTNNQSESAPAFTYDALDPISDDQFLDNDGAQHVYKYFDAGDSDFSLQAMFDEVFPGNTAGGTTPVSNVTINVHYQDDDGKDVNGLSDTSVTGKTGDGYTIPTPTETGYTYEKATVALTGTFTTSQNVVVTYKKNA
ncbi:phage tail protein [Fructilactobacillus sp. Tb1]|uniref:phage tail protein n=1 Tax=Fructilactobacillus sp. Tb1 TaxID=3422304 RepID=UPI003D28F348